MATPAGKTPRGPAEVAKSPLPMKPPDAPLEVIDLDAEASELRAQHAWQLHGQSAKTLVKHEHFRVVLIALQAGRRCQEHRAEESVSVQAIQGRIHVHLASDETVEMSRGRVLALAPAVAHDFEAVEESTLLLTLAWTGHRPGP
jgi:quercetin dioxygenase-like cupin family protein